MKILIIFFLTSCKLTCSKSSSFLIDFVVVLSFYLSACNLFDPTDSTHKKAENATLSSVPLPGQFAKGTTVSFSTSGASLEALTLFQYNVSGQSSVENICEKINENLLNCILNETTRFEYQFKVGSVEQSAVGSVKELGRFIIQ
jgi:hypothetical protein